MKITAIIPTRGDVDCQPIVAHLQTYKEIEQVLVVASSTPYNRYRWAAHAETDLIYTQDDDCITDIGPIIERFGQLKERFWICNAMTREHAAQYPGRQTLIGFGAVFNKLCIGLSVDITNLNDEITFKRDDLFYRESDRIFATVNSHVTVYPTIQILPHANAPNRWWRQPDHIASRDAINKRIFEVTGIEAGCL